VTDAEPARRTNQKRRTRKDLLQAASHLMKQGPRPSLEEIAQETMVSRATAYRYFPNVEALLAEAALDVAVPRAEDVFAEGTPGDPVARLQRLDTVLSEVILANEAAMRTMLAHTLLEWPAGADADLPARQNRRTPLIEAALEPARDQFRPADLAILRQALALVIGTDAMVVFKDVLQLDDARARKVARWAIRALVEAAKKPG
jgi:AcrR family transcriptional regulator